MSVPLFRAETIRPDLSDRDLADYLRSYLTGTLAALKEEQRGVLGGGRAACRKYSDAMDNVVSALHDRARATYLSSAADLKYLLAVIPVGGYGRRGLCPKCGTGAPSTGRRSASWSPTSRRGRAGSATSTPPCGRRGSSTSAKIWSSSATRGGSARRPSGRWST